MKGLIFVNPFLLPKESVMQAEALRREFEILGVKTEIITNGYLKSGIENNKVRGNYDCDFAVFLDKDKYLSKALSKKGIRLFNSHEAVRLCDDKAETYLALSDGGVNIPKTIFGALCYDDTRPIIEGAADEIINELKLPIIVKESYGSMGKGVYLAEDKNTLLKLMEKVKCRPHLFQEYLGSKRGTDVRIIVIGGKAVGAMERHNDSDFRSNVAQGGTCKKIIPEKSFIETAEKCAKILGLDYCGVDILYGKNGEPFVCEVNSNAFFFGFIKATDINVANLYAKYIIDQVK